jgi:hypothetical protein
VLIMEVLNFLHMERLYMAESDFIKISTVEGLWISHNEMATSLGNREENYEEKEENVHSPE